jgi:hypothetical protein
MSTTLAESKLTQFFIGLFTSTEEVRFFNRPGYFLMITAGTIFVSEILIMLLLKFLPPISPFKEALLDAMLLSLTIFPALYFFVFKLLNQHIAQQRRSEMEKNTLIAELHAALNEVNTLQGIVPICASCKKIRDDNGYWHQVEAYISAHSDAKFSHGSCPECTAAFIQSINDRMD